MISAIADETRVPKIAGAAPNTPLTGSHLLDVRKDKPNFWNAGMPAAAISTAMSPRSSGTHIAKNVIVPLYTRSPMAAPPIRALPLCRTDVVTGYSRRHQDHAAGPTLIESTRAFNGATIASGSGA
jgi:hypothetical protein